MALDIDTRGLRDRRAGDTAGKVLEPQLGDDAPACGADEVSQAVMDNLNAWQRWLMATPARRLPAGIQRRRRHRRHRRGI